MAKKKKSILVDPEQKACAICGRRIDLEWHHVMHGIANRKIADKYGLALWLCTPCHGNLHSSGEGTGKDRALMAFAQREFEKKYDHALWFSLFGKNYFAEEELTLAPYCLAGGF